MSPDQFLIHFYKIADAPNGIQRLREMILQLAVQGKLVAQDASDEPAAVLLEKIQAEKERLIREGTIKRQKPLPAMTEAEKPFALPEGWEWVRLGDISSVKGGKRLPANHNFSVSKTERIYIQVTNMKSGSIVMDNLKYISEETYELISKYTISKNDIYITIAGTIGDVGIVPDEFDGMNLTENAAKIVFTHLNKHWLQKLLSSHLLQNQFIEKVNQQAQPKLALHRICSALIPVAPEKEAARILDKISSLMSLCDQLEALQTQRAQLQTTTNQALLEQLSNAPSPLDLQNAWQRLQTHLPKLFTQPEHIKGLRDAILQLAVQGKLVPQDANDEPAAVLLEKIKAEKERLVQAGKIKRQKPLPAITEEEKPFALPKGWECIHFADFAQEVSTGPFGSMIHKSDYIENGIPLINPSHMMNDQIKADFSISVSPEKAEELSSYKIYKGDIVISRRGEMGRCALVDEKSDGWLCGTGSFFIRFDQRINRDFILLLFKSKLVREYLGGNSVGTTMTNLNHSILNRMPMLLPPEKEILKILQKVHSLMQLCDQLESHLKSARHTQEQFARAAVALD